MSNSKPLMLFGASALLLAGFVAAGLAPRLHAGAAPASNAVAVPTLRVTAVQPASGENQLVLPGTLRPWQETAIHARASGYLRRYLVDLGDEVREGQLLAEIDTPELDQDIAAARAQLAQAEAELALAKSTNDRYQELVKRGAISKLEADQRSTALASGEARVRSVRAQLTRLGELSSFRRVTAPFAGRIVARSAEPGMLVAGSEALFRLADTRQLRVSVQVPQSAARGVQPGLEATVRQRELPDRSFAGSVARTAGALDAARTLTTEVRIDNAEGQLLAGASVDVALKLANAQPALLIPANALIVNGHGTQVAVVGAGENVRLAVVRLGRDLGKQLEVLDGLASGDRIVLNPPDTLHEGQQVKVAQEEPAAAKPAAKG